MEKEAHILSILSHRNIVQFYGAVVDPKCCCLVTEYAPYGSLYDFLQREESGELNFAQIIYWARDIAVGISYLHSEAPVKVIHRDLKSKNVVIAADFTLKICDFGASRFLAETAQMTLVGTYPWMAPELIQGKPTSESCDTYSYGIVLWELICQDIPFRGMEGFQVAWAVVEKKQRPPLPESIPTEMRELIEISWHHDPKTRPGMYDIMHMIDQMTDDEDFNVEMDEFLRTRSQWSFEIKSQSKKVAEEETEKVKSDPKEHERRNNQVAIWNNTFRDQTSKIKSIIATAYVEEEETKIECRFSGEGTEAVNTIRDIMQSMATLTPMTKGTPQCVKTPKNA